MSEPLSLDHVAGLAAQLPPAEQRRLAETLLGGTPAGNGTPVRRRWRDIRGAAPHPLCGRDAQEWVSESRREDESHRQPPGIEPLVKIDDALRGVTRLFLDTAPVIYFVEQNPTYADRVNDIFDRIDAGTLGAVTSPVTLAECLVGAIAHGPAHLVGDFTDLITTGPNVTFTWIDAAVAGEAARERVAHRLTLTDAFQVAAALAGGAGALLTNDLTLKRVTALPILVLDELEL